MNQFQDPILIQNLTKIFLLSAISFIVAMALTPVLTHFLYKYKLGKQIREGGDTPVYTKLHEKKSGTPTMGGVLIWVTTLVLALVVAGLTFVFDGSFLNKANFLSRSQTWLPLAILVFTAIVGLVDDFMGARKIGPFGGGLRIKHKLILYTIIAAVGAWWFYYKLGWDSIHIPAFGDFTIGWWYIPLFIFIIIATSFSVNETDGLDGLAGGTLLIAFAAYGAIAFMQNQINLAALCGVISGALLAFLWFNIPPARFFMGDTGAMALGTTLGIVAMLTNSVLVLPIIGFIFVLESSSVIIQLVSKKIFKRKVFISTPIHHHHLKQKDGQRLKLQ